MLVKILDADPDFVEHLKLSTGSKTGSKAYSYAAINFEPLRAQVGELLAQNAALHRKLVRANIIIENARSAAAQLLDKTSQQEIEV